MQRMLILTCLGNRVKMLFVSCNSFVFDSFGSHWTDVKIGNLFYCRFLGGCFHDPCHFCTSWITKICKAIKRSKRPFWHPPNISEKFRNKRKIVEIFRFRRFLFKMEEISGIEPLTSWMPWAPWCILNNIYVKISLISPICLHKNPLYISWCIMFRRNSGMHSGTKSNVTSKK